MTRIAIIGSGIIGSGWAALFAHSGFAVQVVDPAVEAEGDLRNAMAAAKAALGPRCAPQSGTIEIVSDIADLATPDFIQECLPETLALKHKAISDIEDVVDAATVIASSTSGFSPDVLAAGMRHPERLLVGHPCNPPYLMPIVELVNGSQTNVRSRDLAHQLYEEAGREVIVARRSLLGHIINRLQAALWREMLFLWQNDVADLQDLDRAVTRGLAPRWCLMSPTDVFHASGGAHGIEGFCTSLGDEMDRWWTSLGAPEFDVPLRNALIAERATQPVAALEKRRDAYLPEFLNRCDVAAKHEPEWEENHEIA